MNCIELQQMVSRLAYKPGWAFRLDRCGTFSTAFLATISAGSLFSTGTGTGNVSTGITGSCIWPDGSPGTLTIEITTSDSSDPSRMILVQHRFTAPAEPPCGNWRRWLIEQILAVERHEACEFFRIGDDRPFYPYHGADGDLYAVRERSR